MKEDQVTISDRTRVSLVALPFIIGAVLYVSDLKSQILETRAKADMLEVNQKDINKDIKDAITNLSKRIDKALLRLDK